MQPLLFLLMGFKEKWQFLARTTPEISSIFEPLESAIKCKLIPQLTGQGIPGDIERDLFSLPARLGGLGLVNPVHDADGQFQFSRSVSGPLVDRLMIQNCEYSDEVYDAQLKQKKTNLSSKNEALREKVNRLCESIPNDFKLAITTAQEKGASSWLTALPIAEYDFNFHKSDFRDALALRYGWQPARLPLKCVCGADFVVEHALNCHHGGLPTIRHNELRDLTANLMSEICHDVTTEPELLPLTGENMRYRSAITTDGARLDVRAQGFWGSRNTKDFFDVKVFNPFAKSYRNRPLTQVFTQMEQMKRRSYDQRVRDIEHGTMTPLIFSLNGGLGRAATVTYKRLASLLSLKWNEPYSIVMGWLRCTISFSLTRSAISCLRSSRSTARNRIPSSISLTLRETNLDL